PHDALPICVMQLQIEQQALQKETDESSVARREAIEAELADREEQLAAMTAEWQREKEAIEGGSGGRGQLAGMTAEGEREKESIEGVSAVMAELEEARVELERVQRAADLGRAAELQY